MNCTRLLVALIVVFSNSLAGSNPRCCADHATVRPKYRLDSGDVVAVIIDHLLGDFSSTPIHMPCGDTDGTLPANGHPMLVLPDGTLPLPVIDPLSVRGLTVTAARDKVATAYLEQDILKDKNQVLLTLLRKRTVSVNVIHNTNKPGIRRVSRVKLPAGRAGVLEAIVQSSPFDPRGNVTVFGASRLGQGPAVAGSRLMPGDMIVLSSNNAGHFFTGGLLAGNTHALPSGRLLNALNAISLAGGLPHGHLGRVALVRRNGGVVRMSYRHLLANPNALIVGPGDTLIVR